MLSINADERFWFWCVVGALALSQCSGPEATARTPSPYAEEIKALQQQAKAETKAANKEVAAERKAAAKACDKSYAADGKQLDVNGRVGCAR